MSVLELLVHFAATETTLLINAFILVVAYTPKALSLLFCRSRQKKLRMMAVRIIKTVFSLSVPFGR